MAGKKQKGSAGYKQAVEFFGGVPGLAKALGIERQAIYQWDGRIPKLRAFQIESVTGGKLRATEIMGRPERGPA